MIRNHAGRLDARPSRPAVRGVLHTTRGRLALVATVALGVALAVTGSATIVSWSVLNHNETDTALVDQTRVVTNDFLDRNALASSDIPLESEDGVPVDTVILDEHDAVLAQ